MAKDVPADPAPATISPQWHSQIAIYRDLAHKADIHADLLDTVDPRWRGRIQVHNGGSQILILPVGDTLNQGRYLRVRAKARWTFELTDKPVHGVLGTVIKKRVVPFPPGGAALDEFLGAMLEGRTSDPGMEDRAGDTGWRDKVASFRRFSYSHGLKADLLLSVNPTWTQASEANDNGQRLEIQRLGDTTRDGVKLIIRLDGDRYLFDLRRQQKMREDEVLREAEAAIDDAPVLLDQLLTTMLSERVAQAATAHETAQEHFKILLRDKIAPVLRDMGFKGSGTKYAMSRDSYRVTIEFQKDKWSTRDSVSFDVNVSVVHPATIELFNVENQRARQMGKAMEGGAGYGFHSCLGNLARLSDGGFPWIVRPGDPLDVVANDVIEAVRQYFLPVIEQEVQRPLPSPTPLQERADHTYVSPAGFLRKMSFSEEEVEARLELNSESDSKSP